MADYNKSGTLPITATFKADSDPSNPLTTHVWKVDGTTDTSATTDTFTKVFNAYKDAYTIEHSGSNSCGSNCTPVTKTISITATPQATTGTIPLEYIVAAAIGLGVIGLMWTSLPKK